MAAVTRIGDADVLHCSVPKRAAGSSNASDEGMIALVATIYLYWRRNDGRGSVFYFTCMLSAKMYVHYKKQNDCAQ